MSLHGAVLESVTCRRPVQAHRASQCGQALIYGIFVLIGGLAALFFLFNTGQLVREKTKLINTADAVAYSGGLMHARALNFDAYSNRALVANEVIVAQMVSLSSWSQYASTHAQNLPMVFPECADPQGYGAAAGALFNYGPLYAVMCYLTVQYAGQYIQQIADQVPPVTEAIVTAVEVNKAAIRLAQTLLHAPLYFEQVRGDVMQQVADANYQGDGTVQVEPRGVMSVGGITMNNDWPGFTRRYSDSERVRFKEITTVAANSDPFTRSRSWDAQALLPNPDCLSVARIRYNKVLRRGGTELIGLDEWKAEDTESFHQNYRRKLSCRQREQTIGYGEQQAHPSGADQNDGNASLGGSPATNPVAHGQASSSHWTQYTGLPSYYDLSADALAKDNPTLKMGVRVSRARQQLRTSDGNTGQIRAGGSTRLNAYASTVAADVMAAVSTSEVFFERPLESPRNLYGIQQGRPRELGSLFNPYWQVRLIESSSDLRAQQLRQGAVLP